MYKTIVIMNEQHSLLPEQEKILNEKFNFLAPRVEVDSEYAKWEHADPYEDVVCSGWNVMSVPAGGWSKEEIDNNVRKLKKAENVVFVSPVPYMLKIMTYNKGMGDELGYDYPNIYLFHNDNREKKELPNGKVISVIAQTGWELV